jgi:hypothetical protein
VFVTEVGYQFAGSDNDKEFVEIHNPSAAVTYDLGGCILSDSAGPMDADAVVLPAPTLVGPGDYLVVAGAMSEVAGDVVLPATLGFGGDDAVQLHCGATLIDTVAWTTSGIGGADDVSAQLDLAQVTAAGATNNDAAASWCSTPTGSIYGATMRRGTPGAANVACVAPPACPAATHLVLNEIDYDQSGSDTAEFVEIFNPHCRCHRPDWPLPRRRERHRGWSGVRPSRVDGLDRPRRLRARHRVREHRRWCHALAPGGHAERRA